MQLGKVAKELCQVLLWWELARPAAYIRPNQSRPRVSIRVKVGKRCFQLYKRSGLDRWLHVARIVPIVDLVAKLVPLRPTHHMFACVRVCVHVYVRARKHACVRRNRGRG